MSWWKRLLLWLAGQAPAIIDTVKPKPGVKPPPPPAPPAKRWAGPPTS